MNSTQWLALGLCAVMVVEAGGQTVNVPQTEEARQLGERAILESRQAWYHLGVAGVAGFEAKFNVQREGQAVGVVHLTGDVAALTTQSRYEGEALDAKRGKWLADQLTDAVRTATYDQAPPPGLYGADAGDRYVVVNPGAASDTVRQALFIVAKDHSELVVTTFYTNGMSVKQTSRTLESGGKRYLRTMEVESCQPERETVLTQFTLTYTRQDGAAFPKKIAMTEKVGQRVAQWAAELRELKLRRGQAQAGTPDTPTPEARPRDDAAPPQVPRQEANRALAQDVVRKINASCYLLPGAGLRAFRAVFAVTRDGQPQGRLTASWDGGVARVTPEGLEGGKANWLRNSAQWAMMVTLLGVMPEGDAAGFAAAHGGGYALDRSDEAQGMTRLTWIDSHLRRTRDLMRYKDGLELDTVFQWASVMGKTVVAGITRVARHPQAPEMKNVFRLEYADREGFLFFKTLEIEDVFPMGRNVWKMALESAELAR